MNFTLYKDWSELPKQSQSLFSDVEKDSVFLSREWLEAITPHLITQNQTLLLCCVIDENAQYDVDVLAILPLLTNTNREWTSLTHPYSALFSIYLSNHQQSDILQCLCDGLTTLDFDYLTLAPISTEDSKLLQFQQAMETTGLSCYRNHKAYNWFHRIEKKHSYSDYLAERPSKLRNTLIRKHRKLERTQNYQIKLFIHDEIDQALADYHNLYTVSWKANEQQQILVKDVVKQFANRGWLRLAIMTVGDQAIAAQLWFVTATKASIFRLVYDKNWKDYSPGTILMTYLLEQVIDKDKVIEIDFLSGNDAYKKDWMSERRERQSLVCVKNKITQKRETKGIFKKITHYFLNTE